MEDEGEGEGGVLGGEGRVVKVRIFVILSANSEDAGSDDKVSGD